LCKAQGCKGLKKKALPFKKVGRRFKKINTFEKSTHFIKKGLKKQKI